MYNRGQERLDKFKTYAKLKDVSDSAYKIVKDLKEIGKT